MRLPRRLRNDSPNDKRRHLDTNGDDGAATLRPDGYCSLVAAVDNAIVVVAGSVALPAGEVIDLLLDLRTRVASAAAGPELVWAEAL